MLRFSPAELNQGHIVLKKVLRISRGKSATVTIINSARTERLKGVAAVTRFSPPHPVMEEVAAAPPAEEEDMGSRSNKNPSSSALNTKTERES